MTTDIAPTIPVAATETLPAIPTEIANANWGAIEEIETNDLLIPKIFHQQGNSTFTKDGLARPGDFCDSITKEVLATKDKGIELIIFGQFKTMVTEQLEIASNKFKFQKSLIVVPQNAREVESLLGLHEIAGQTIRNSLQYNFYCLLPERKKEVPYVFSFKSTKAKVAKKVNTMLFKLAQINRNGASILFKFTNVKEENDQGDWLGLEVSQGRDTTLEEMMRARAWYMKSKSQKFVVVEEDAPSDTTDTTDTVEGNMAGDRAGNI